MENLNDQKSASGASGQQLDTKELSRRQIEELLFTPSSEAEYFLEEATPYYEKTIKDFGDDVDTGQIAVDFDLDNPRVQEFIDNKKQQFAETVNETTWRTLRDDLIEGVDNGEGIPELADRVEDVFDDAHANRSEMIARTEVNGAANFGTHEAYTQSGVVEQKTWVAALDERTRPAHRQAHNQTVAQDKQFTVGGEKLMYPGDPSGSAGNIIQCRCTLVPVTEEDAEDVSPDNIPEELSDSFDDDGNFYREGHKKHLKDLEEDFDVPDDSSLDEVNYEEEVEVIKELGGLKHDYTKRVNDQINKNILRENDLLDGNSMQVKYVDDGGEIRAPAVGPSGRHFNQRLSDNIKDFVDEFNEKDVYDQLQDYNELRYRIKTGQNFPGFKEKSSTVMDQFDDFEEMKRAKYSINAAVEDLGDDTISEMRETIIANHKDMIDTDDVDSILRGVGESNVSQAHVDKVEEYNKWLVDNIDSDLTSSIEDRIAVGFENINAAGQYNHATKAIIINDSVVGTGPQDTTYVHEMLHAVHKNNDSVGHHVAGFFAERTDDLGADIQKLKDYSGIRGYEVGFMHNYMGRTYSGKSYRGEEVLSKGVEFMHKKKDEFFKDHLDEFNMVLSVMRGLTY